MDRLRPPLPSVPSPRRTTAIALFAAAFALGVTAPRAAIAQGAGDPAQARELYKKGKKAYDDGNLREAYEAYLAAWKLQKSFDIAGNLAGIELETARYRDAAEHLKFALTNLPVSGDADKRRARIEGLLRDAKKQIGALTIKVTPDVAEISIDGRALTRAEAEGEVFVDAGEHVVSATAQDHAPSEQKIRVAKGATLPVSIALQRGAAVTYAPAPSPITVAGFIASGLGLAAGTALAIISKTKADAADSQFAALEKRGPNACAGPAPPDVCIALHDARASRDTFANAALWTFVGATAVAGGTLVYTLLAPRSAPKAASTGATGLTAITALPAFSHKGGGVVVTGSF